MPYPDKYTLSYSYTGFSQSQGDGSFPGVSMDTDLAGVVASVDDAIDFLMDTFNSDGTLKAAAYPGATALNTYVTTATTAATTASAAAVTASAVADAYDLDLLLTKAGNLSGLASAATARTNLGLGAVALLASIATANIDNSAITTAKIADSNVTTGKIADAAVTFAKVPDGFVVGFSNVCTGTASGGAFATTTSSTPAFDDSIPQNTEGTEMIACAHTPKSATSKLVVDALIPFSTSATANVVAALFRDSDAGAIAADVFTTAGAGYRGHIRLRAVVTAGSTSETTFKVRMGLDSGTLTVNGTAGARLWGGIAQAGITVTEIKAS